MEKNITVGEEILTISDEQKRVFLSTIHSKLLITEQSLETVKERQSQMNASIEQSVNGTIRKVTENVPQYILGRI